MPLPSRVRSALPSLLTAALGAGLWGVAEAGRSALSFRGLWGDQDLIWLMLAGSVSVVAVAAPVGMAVGAVLAGRPLVQRSWGGFLAGLVTVLAWDLAVRWFAGPDPFRAAFPLQGNPVAFGVVLVILLAVAGGLAWRVRTWRVVTACVGGLVLLLGAWVFTGVDLPVHRKAPPRPDVPNILWVTLDTVRADHVGAYGSRVQTPSFDRVAREGALFTRAFAPLAVTGPSHTTMLTGAGPWKHGILLNGIPVPDDLPTLPEILQENGYRTAAFVSSYVLLGRWGFERGFDTFDDDFDWLKGSGDLLVSRTFAMAWRHFHPDETLERRGDRTTDLALTWLQGQRSPWFVWVHLFDPHGPYEPPAPFDGMYYEGDPRDPAKTSMAGARDVAAYLEESLRGITDRDYVVAQYDGEISFADAQLGRLLEHLDRAGLADRTVVVVNGDHGESLGEHDLWFDHGANLYDPSTHVPMAMRIPTLVGPRTVTDLVELMDIAPTLMEIVGLEPPPTMDGLSVLRVLGGAKGHFQARGLCFDRKANLAARSEGTVSKPTWRMASLRSTRTLFVSHEHATGGGDELYELDTDPGQVTNTLARMEADPVGNQFLQMLRKDTSDLMGGMGQEQIQRSAAERPADVDERLRALGYIE